MKGKSRAKKERIISNQNPEWKDLGIEVEDWQQGTVIQSSPEDGEEVPIKNNSLKR